MIGIKFTRRFIIDGVPYRIDQLPKAQVTKERALKTEAERVDLAMAIYNFERNRFIFCIAISYVGSLTLANDRLILSILFNYDKLIVYHFKNCTI